MTDNEFNEIKERLQDARDTIVDYGRIPRHITDREALIKEVERLRSDRLNLMRSAQPFVVTYELMPSANAPILIPNQDHQKPQATVGQLWELLALITDAKETPNA